MTERTYQHEMLREIYQQPAALEATLRHYSGAATLRDDVFAPALHALTGKQSLLIAASGSSRHAGLIGEILLEDLAGLAVEVEYASEYIYRSTQSLTAPAFLVLSQSGETIDTLEALREAHGRGASTIAVTNHVDSSMAKLADASLPTLAGIEKAIPATKSFTTQLLVLNLLALFAARVRGRMTRAVIESHLDEMQKLPALLEKVLPTWETQMKEIAARLNDADTHIFLGRGLHYPIAREGALKLKESAYAQAEGYPTGELKHGPNALVSKATPIIALATKDPRQPDSLLRYEKTVNLLRDLRPLGAEIVALATAGDTLIPTLAQNTVFIPACAENLTPILEVVPLQLLAYFTAVGRGINVDSPRNLSKAVLSE